ncbi:chromate efflux transporter [Marinomonas sp.]|uniref:chromate efflux transporter n=1 Tax=Marinomonas sp. TaxID=1904862 RepID=UPI003A9547D3
MTEKNLSFYKRVIEVFVSFLLLGFTSFGGPAAHLGYFNQTFIKRKQWASESQYAQWVALSQIVPGPGSSQVGFALGYHRAGIMGALAAFIGFTLPSFVIMVLLAQFGQTWQENRYFDGIVHSLKLLAVVVVADACVSMWRSFCQTTLLAALAVLCGLFIVLFPFGLATLWALLLAVLVSLFVPAKATSPQESLPPIRFSGVLLAIVVGVFIASFALNDGLSALFGRFYQAGALVFGGGHVVLPMLSSFVLPSASGMVSESTVLLGYAAAQAVPGPMFTMASFLGAIAAPEGQQIWWWAGVATLAVFLSGLLLMLSAQGVWQSVFQRARCRSAAACLNAAVVGILLAALYSPIATSSLLTIWDLMIVGVGFVVLRYKRPSIFVFIAVFVLIGLVGSA